MTRVRAGEDDPTCQEIRPDGSRCGGMLKSATISFGQNLVAEDLRAAEEAAAACDLLLAVGSTLGVYPAAGLVPIAARYGAAIVIVNGGPTDLDAAGRRRGHRIHQRDPAAADPGPHASAP